MSKAKGALQSPRKGGQNCMPFHSKAYTAIAAKMARTVHAVIHHGEPYRPFFEGAEGPLSREPWRRDALP